MIDGGRVYGADELHPFEWQTLGEMKKIQEEKRMVDLAITLWGTK